MNGIDETCIGGACIGGAGGIGDRGDEHGNDFDAKGERSSDTRSGAVPPRSMLDAHAAAGRLGRESAPDVAETVGASLERSIAKYLPELDTGTWCAVDLHILADLRREV